MSRLTRSLNLLFHTIFWVFLTTIVAVVLFGNGGHDDSHITYWAADSICRGGLPQNYNGEWVEQSSTPGFTVLLASFACVLPVSTPTLGWLLSLLGRALTIGAVVGISDRHRPGSGWWVAPIIATEPLLAYWGTSGMEMTFTALAYVLLPWSIVKLVEGRLWPYVGAVILVVLIRPEGPIVLGCELACLAVWSLGTESELRSLWTRALGIPFCIGLPLFGIRRLVYGLWMPQPVISKMHGTKAFERGTEYFFKYDHLVNLTVVVAVLAIVVGGWAVIRRRESPLYLVLATGIVAAVGAFVVLSGGDWMKVGRFFVPFAAATLALSVYGVGFLSKPIVAVVVLVLMGRHGQLTYEIALKTGTGRPISDAIRIRNELPSVLQDYPLVEYANIAHLRDIHLIHAIEEVLPSIRSQINGPVTLFSGQAGMVPYYLFSEHRDLVFVDANSLVTNNVNRCLPSKSFRNWPVGQHFSLRTLFVHRDVVSKRCGVEMPAIVFESGQKIRYVLKKLDYHVVFRLRGVRHPRDKIFGNTGRASGWVAVRNDLLPLDYGE